MSIEPKVEKVKANDERSMMVFVSGEMLSLALSKTPDFEDLIEQARLEILANQDNLNPRMESLINKVAEITVDTLRSKKHPTIH